MQDNLLKEKHPILFNQINKIKNEEFTMITCGSNKKMWWICENDHEWQAAVSARVHGTGCPICYRNGGELLINKCPRLIKEWDFKKNKNLDAEKITTGSNRKVWWLCEKNHSWQAFVFSRVNGYGCPICKSLKKLLVNEYPNLLLQIDREKNKDIDIFSLTSGSSKKIWWKCEKGHSWKAIVANRTKEKGVRCAICYGRTGELLINKFPELIKEWDYDKNKDIDITTITFGSAKKVWWICKNNHSWKTRVNIRTNKHGCPYCIKPSLMLV